MALLEPRRHLLDNNLLYLFSYDANLEMRREEIGFVPGGVRVNIFPKPRETRVYHVARERTAAGGQAIEGTVEWGADWAMIRSDDVGKMDVRLMIRTDDGALIYSWYEGLFAAGPRGFRQMISEKPPMGTEHEPLVAPCYITPRYQTAHPKYEWLMKHQCVGLGQLQIIKSTVRSVSFDIYALDG
jgi:hypothetical protein